MRLPTLPACAVLLAAAPMQGPGAAGLDRQAMWPAPSAADWQRPCLVRFQRSWEDALAVSEVTGKPILVCVNMDGEIASEHYAGIRYRQPQTAALYAPYVCVIASVYRHTPRDYDEQGGRILCPRFGSVTCGEHIAIEPGLFEKYFDGKRVAPRHIGLRPEGGEMYDVYYAWDTDSVFAAIREGAAGQPPPRRAHEFDRPLAARVASRDVRDREAVEEAYRRGGRAQRRALLEAAIASPDAAPLDLLRLAVFGSDRELIGLAGRALARSGSESAVDLIAAALPRLLETGEREGLIAALERLGSVSPRARLLAAVNRGLYGRSATLDLEAWLRAMDAATAPAPATDWYGLQAQLEGRALAVESGPADAGAELELAEASLAIAIDPQTAGILGSRPFTATRLTRLMLEDARRAALRAGQLGAGGWRLDAVVALASHYLGDVELAHARAEAAVEAMPPGADGWNAAAVLALFVQARRQAIIRAVREKRAWPPAWMADVHAACSILARHPLAAATQVGEHYAFLQQLGAFSESARVLTEGLARFPDSWELHRLLQNRLLREKGPAGLEAAYDARLKEAGTARDLEWFAGYASLLAAEAHRRANRREQAAGAYGRALGHFDRAIAANPACRGSADHYAALALAGRARVALERGELDAAAAELLASLSRRPEAAASQDGLGFSPAATARTLLARLAERQDHALLARLGAALEKLGPEVLLPPLSERPEPPGPRAEPGPSSAGGRRPSG